ncbi:MAG: hypothetical protein R2788_03935 [Saprospiraceae bacterium]
MEHYAKQFNTIELNSTHYGIRTGQPSKNGTGRRPPIFAFAQRVCGASATAGIIA